MKANEAPEKIYISPNTEESTYYVSNQYNRLIEYTRTDAFIEKACRCYCDDICEKGMAGMCFHKHDGQGQVKNTFKYNECDELKLLINAMKG